MKLTFGPVHPISIILYVVGIPLLTISLIDQFSGSIGLSEVRRLQVFLGASIALVMASVLNLGLHIYRQWRSNQRSHKNHQ